jgi:NitT/TauT family transport system substrate-binding protein
MRAMISRRSLLFAALACALASGCNKDKPDAAGTANGPAMTKMKLALNWVPEPEFGGFYAARERGDYKKAGLDVEIQGGGAGVPVVQMVATGQAEVGIAGADEVLTARAHGADVVALFATYQTSPQGILAHASRGANNIGDLMKSGTLAIEPGLAYAKWLKKKFGEPTAKIVPYDGGVARFLTDKDFAQQCYVTSEPIAAKKKGADTQVFLIADTGFNPYVGVVITSRATWEKKQDKLRAFVNASRAGWDAYLTDPKATNELMGKLNTAMDAETFAAAAAEQKPLIQPPSIQRTGHAIGEMTKERWEELAKQLVELGSLEKAPASDFVIAIDPGH